MQRPYLLGAAVFVASLAIFLALAHAYGCAQIGGLRHWVLHDDFMISERYARNLARGRGLVFKPGERVEGFSDPLMVLGAARLQPGAVEPGAHPDLRAQRPAAPAVGGAAGAAG